MTKRKYKRQKWTVSTGEYQRSATADSPEAAAIEAFRKYMPNGPLGLLTEVTAADGEQFYCVTESLLVKAGYEVDLTVRKE